MVSAGVPNTAMRGFAPMLGEEERWAVVTYVRTLSLEGAQGASAQSMETDHVAQLDQIRRAVDAAVAAHRRGDPEAMAFATNAYLRFEPLEKVLAESDSSRIDPLEQAFVAFRTALASPSAGDPDLLGRQLAEALDGAAPLMRPRSGGATGGATRGRIALGLVSALLLLAMAYAIRTHARRSMAAAGPSKIS
jgi:hypothetical protein